MHASFELASLHFFDLLRCDEWGQPRLYESTNHGSSFSSLTGSGTGGSASPARIDRAHSDRERSASKEAGHPSDSPASRDHLSNSSLFHPPRLAGRRSPLLRASNEGLLSVLIRPPSRRQDAALPKRPRVPRARRSPLIASHSTRHIPSQSNTAPLHRRREDPAQAVCRHHQPNR